MRLRAGQRALLRVASGGAIVLAWLLSGSPAAAQGDFPTLQQAISATLDRSPSVVDAIGTAAVAQALQAGARVSSLGNPFLEVKGDRGRFTQDVQVISTLYLPVEVQGQRGARIAEWERFVGWRQAYLKGVRAAALGEAVSAYGTVRVAAARLEQAEHAERDAREEASRVERRLSAGDTTTYEVSVAASESSRWSQLRVEASLALSQSLTRLAQLIGARPATPEPAPAAPPPLQARLPPAGFAAWLPASPALRALEAESHYWRANGERAKKEAWAPLSVILTGGRGDLGEGRVGAGVAWSFPLFRRGQGEVARATAEAERAYAVRGSLQAAINERLRGAAEIYGEAVAAIAELDSTGIPASERVLQAANLSQQSGKGEVTRVLIARRDLASARQRRLDLVQTSWNSYAELAAFKGALP